MVKRRQHYGPWYWFIVATVGRLAGITQRVAFRFTSLPVFGCKLLYLFRGRGWSHMWLLRTGIKGPEWSEDAGNGVGRVLNSSVRTAFLGLANDIMTSSGTQNSTEPCGTKTIMTVPYRRFGTTYRSDLHWPLQIGQVGFHETSVSDHNHTLCNIPEERTSPNTVAVGQTLAML